MSWYGNKYKFTENQARAFRLLLQAYNDPRKTGVRQSDIGQTLETVAKNYRLMETFRQRCGGKRGFHPAWTEIIEHIGNGAYRLKVPK